MIKIEKIIPDSIAAEVGMKPGDYIIKINGKEINDQLDFRFYTADDKNIILVNRNDSDILVEIEKEYHDDIGCELEKMKIKSCINN